MPKDTGYHQKTQNAPQPIPIKSFYEPNTKNIRKDLFDTLAEQIAHTFVVGKLGITSTQLRRIYDEVKRFEQLLEVAGADTEIWDKQLPYIKMIKSKIRYTVARAKKDKGKAYVPYYENVAAFITEGIDLIYSEDDYRIFTALFEAVYGFYYEHRPDQK